MVMMLTSGVGERLERAVERGGLAAAGGAGHQDQAVRLAQPAARTSSQLAARAKPELGEVLQQHARVEDAHDQLLAEGGRHGGDAQLDLALAAGGLDAAVLRPPLLGDVHARQHLDARRRSARARPWGCCRRGGARRRCACARRRCSRRGSMWMSLARWLEGVVQQVLDRAHHRLVGGLELLDAAELDELLEVADVHGAPSPACSSAAAMTLLLKP